MAGATTRTPVASLSAQVRNTLPSSPVETTSPRRSAVGPKAALTSAADDGAKHKGEHVIGPLEAPSHAQPAQQQGGHDERERVANRLSEDRAQRGGEIGQQQVADRDARPETNPVQE